MSCRGKSHWKVTFEQKGDRGEHVLQLSGVGAPGQKDSKGPMVGKVGSGLALTRDNQEARLAEAE